jgi:predicted adenine nucleotide alpha hydrolase (AANH) superfamily ATPase
MSNGKIVLMSCCAPCSAAAIKELKGQGADFVVLFHNPNIFPRAEHDRRLAEQIKLCEKHGVKYAVGDYDHGAWLDCVRGLENEPERGRRCAACFRHRLKLGAKWARARGYGAITSVFGASAHKDQAQVDAAARDLGVEYMPRKFPYDPEPDSYRQKYCGCEFSETYKKAKENG